MGDWEVVRVFLVAVLLEGFLWCLGLLMGC